MADVEITKDAHDKEVDRLEDLFWEANRHTLDKPKLRKVITDADTRYALKYIKTVPRDRLGEYDLDVPEWDDGRAEFAVWQRPDGAYETPQPRMDFSQCRSGQTDTRKATNVDQGVFFQHLPGGFRQFNNKREAAAWLSQNMPDVEFRD